MKKNKKIHNIKETILKHIKNNSKEYILVFLIFVIGVFLGVMFINNAQESQMSEITTYFNSFIENLKTNQQLDNISILKTSITNNIILAITLWFFGTTVIGIPIVLAIVLFRGFCLGYSISTIIFIMGIKKGIIFVLISLVAHNILYIPALIAIAVSGIKLYKSIVKDRKKENVKIEVLRHTIFSLLMLMVLCTSSIVEMLISTNCMKNFIDFF